jgi:hypothetical protein
MISVRIADFFADQENRKNKTRFRQTPKRRGLPAALAVAQLFPKCSGGSIANRDDGDSLLFLC